MYGKQKTTPMVRVNVRISKKLNDEINAYSEETGMPRATFIHFAIETYFKQLKALSVMDDALNRLAELEKQQRGPDQGER